MVDFFKSIGVDIEHPPYVPAKFFTKGRIKPVLLIVLHSAEFPKAPGAAMNIARYLQNPPREGSAHYVVDNAELVQCVYDRDTAWHCKNANANGIGIEHAGYAKQTREEWLDDYGKAMLDISARLSAYLCKKFNIPVQRALFKGVNNPTVMAPGFCGHADVPLHGLHWDPGLGFPWDWYLYLVKSYVNPAK